MIHAATRVKSHVEARNFCGACGNRTSHRIAAETPPAWTATQTAISVQATRSFEITGLAPVVSHRWIGGPVVDFGRQAVHPLAPSTLATNDSPSAHVRSCVVTSVTRPGRRFSLTPSK